MKIKVSDPQDISANSTVTTIYSYQGPSPLLCSREQFLQAQFPQSMASAVLTARTQKPELVDITKKLNTKFLFIPTDKNT